MKTERPTNECLYAQYFAAIVSGALGNSSRHYTIADCAAMADNMIDQHRRRYPHATPIGAR